MSQDNPTKFKTNKKSHNYYKEIVTLQRLEIEWMPWRFFLFKFSAYL